MLAGLLVLLAGFTLLATLIFHSNLGDQTQMLFFMKNLSIAGGLLLVVSDYQEFSSSR